MRRHPLSLSLFLILILFHPQSSEAHFYEHFNRSGLRFDYLHGADGEREWARPEALHQMVWYAGSDVNLVDTFWYGSYRLEVLGQDDEVLYAKGYSTLFNEWLATPEADSVQRVFRESVTMPFPLHPVTIRLSYRTGSGTWEDMLRYPVDPSSIFIRREAASLAEPRVILHNGPTERKLDIAILSEGYQAGERQQFFDDCMRFREYLAGCSPFKERMGDINIRAVWIASPDSGTDNPGMNEWRHTVFNSSFYTFGSERYLTVTDYWTVMDYASTVPFDQVVIMVNSAKYGGGGVYNYFTVATAYHEAADFLLVHEFGHAFAGLGDEYYTSDVAVEDFYPTGREPWEPNLTTLVDFGSKWQDMLDPGTPVPTPIEKEAKPQVGVYEGGGYVAQGVYRPAVDCTMKSVRYDDFCPVCTRAINRMLDWETGR